MSKRALTVLVSVLALAAVVTAVRRASAQLERGAAAPPFTAQAALGGSVETFDLHTALAHGPVVLYFFPKSFTSGCTTEAHLFSEHIADYRKLGATVIGVSGDDIATQQKFSTQECRSAFLVASDPGLKIAAAYNAKLLGTYSNRTSYVIARDGTIAYAYTSLDPSKHVENTLGALRRLESATR